ncbi:hypothetical protein D9M72_600650 [compost metagenome]
MQQRIVAMGFRREAPRLVLVLAEANEDHSFALLRHTIVGGVNQGRLNDILGSWLLNGVTVQTLEVVEPLFAWFGLKRGILHLAKDVIEVVSE